jgi:hypothetical protein
VELSKLVFMRDAKLPAAPPADEMRFEPLGGGVSMAPGFLSLDETSHLMALVERPDVGGWQPSPTGGVAFASPRLGPAFADAMNADPVVARIEERIARATSIPVHPDEDQMTFARIRDRATSDARGRHYPPFGLHHETDTRPHRATTVLMYLQEPREGGHTIFPLLGAPRGQLGASGARDPALAMRHTEMRGALRAQFGGPPQWARQAATPGPESDHPLMDLLEEACRGSYGLSVAPRRGAALMWSHWNWTSNRHDRTRWHDGCNVVRGTKTTLQKFKELPRERRTFSDPSGVKYHPQMPRGVAREARDEL